MDEEHKKRVQDKIAAYIEKAKTSGTKLGHIPKRKRRKDSLSQVIKTQKQADEFMEQLKRLI